MKKVSSFCMAAALCAAFTFGAAGPALSAVFTPGPVDLPSLPGNGFPKWYTDPLNATPPPPGGLSLAPCLSQAVSPAGGIMCVLLADTGGFDPANTVAFPGNFPQEFFYAIADARILNLGGVNGNRADYRAALEGTFDNGIVALGDQTTFTRVRFTVDAAVNGTYRITHPFGQRTFTGVVAGQDAIDVQEDIGAGTAGGPFLPITTPVGAASQAGGGLQQFLVQAVAGVPAPITVGTELFIGDPNVDQLVVGATQPDPNNPLLRFNSFMVEVDPAGGTTFQLVGRTDNFQVAGQIIALIVTPAAGTDFGVWKLNTASTRKTFSLQNLSPNLITPVIAAIVPNSNPAVPSPDFSIAASAVAPCLGSVAAGSSCNFDVIFNTLTTGAKSAAITITGGVDVPPVQTTVTGIGDGILPTLPPVPNQFFNTPNATISGPVSDNIGAPTVQVSLNGAIPVPATVTNGAWSLSVGPLNLNAANSISVTSTDSAQPAPGNQTTVTATITHDNIVPVVSLTAPANALVINKPTLQALTFTATDANPFVTIFKVDGTAVTPVPATLGALPDGPRAVSIETTDAAGNVGIATNNITVALTNGDFDGSGTVTINDALQALRVSVNLVPQPAPNTVPFFHGDVAPLGSPNGTIDISDALLILRKVVGLETSF